MTETPATETPATEDREIGRLAAIVPDIELDDIRPDFLPDEPEDHPWVIALELNLADRLDSDSGGGRWLEDMSVTDLDSDTAYILGYETAIHVLRALANGDGMEVALVNIAADPQHDDQIAQDEHDEQDAQG